MPNCQTNLFIALSTLSLLFCNFIYTTADHLGRYEPSSPISCRAPWLTYFQPSSIINCYLYLTLVHCTSPLSVLRARSSSTPCRRCTDPAADCRRRRRSHSGRSCTDARDTSNYLALQNETKMLIKYFAFVVVTRSACSASTLIPHSSVKPNLAKFCPFGKFLEVSAIFEGLFSIWQNFESTGTKIWNKSGKFSLL